MLLDCPQDLKRRLGGFGEVFFGKNWLQCDHSELRLSICTGEICSNGKFRRKGEQALSTT